VSDRINVNVTSRIAVVISKDPPVRPPF